LCDNNDAILTNTDFVNNTICHLFEEIRYEMNAIEIDKCKNVGLTTVMKNWLSLNPSQSVIAENAEWIDKEEKRKIANQNGYFDVNIPLSFILRFAEDYHKVVVNAKHELILTRSSNDLNAVYQTTKLVDAEEIYEDFKINITRIEWLMPYVTPSNTQKIHLLDVLKKEKSISMSFRSWELYEYPMLPMNTNHVWTVKTANQLEKPRFVILAFQTDRKNTKSANASQFDHCNIKNVKLYLNSQCYPYNNLNLDISKYQYATLYDMYANFQKSYYGKESEPLLKKNHFIMQVPLIVIDCSKQNESLKSAPVDVRLEFETKENIPGGTTAYCLILHDRIVQYSPISGDVKKVI